MIDLEDEWNHFNINFTVYLPLIDHNQIVRIQGDCPELGQEPEYKKNRSRSPRDVPSGIVMKKMQTDIPWLKNKYGQSMQPYRA